MAEPPETHLTSISARACALIETLNLQYLPHESGYIGFFGTSPNTITTVTGRSLAAQSHNYYLLTSMLNVNCLHWLEPDDTHVLIEGGPVEYFIFHPETVSSPAQAEKVVLGKEFTKGEVPIIHVPGGCWKALKLCDGAEYALMVNVLSPEFTADRVKIGFGDEADRKQWLKTYQGKGEWATENFLRELVGPTSEGV